MPAFVRGSVSTVIASLLCIVQYASAGPCGINRGDWKLQGCYTDQAGRSRTLSGASYVDDNDMSVEACVAFCKNGGYNYAGVEYGQECYCDYALQSGGSKVDASECNMPCSGDASETCGAGNRVNVYYSGSPEPKSPTKVGTWKYTGCFVDSVDARKLERPLAIPAGVFVESCTKACQVAGFQYAGMEYTDECWCGNTFNATKVPDADCHMACKGNHDEFCGGADRLAVYHNENPSSGSQDCLTTLNSFKPLAVYKSPPKLGPKSRPIKLIDVITISRADWSVFSTCSICSSSYTSFTLKDGAITPKTSRAPAPISWNVNAGETPSFLEAASSNSAYHGYCAMTNPSGGPKLLANNGHADKWSLCANSTALGRLDLVFAPTANHPHYSLKNCETVTIQLT